MLTKWMYGFWHELASLHPRPWSFVVGPKRRRFAAHEDLLCYIVPYFKKTFEGRFREAKEGTVCFAEADPAARELFIDWLYGRPSSLTPANDPFAPLLILYVSADM